MQHQKLTFVIQNIYYSTPHTSGHILYPHQNWHHPWRCYLFSFLFSISLFWCLNQQNKPSMVWRFCNRGYNQHTVHLAININVHCFNGLSFTLLAWYELLTVSDKCIKELVNFHMQILNSMFEIRWQVYIINLSLGLLWFLMYWIWPYFSD